MYAFQILDNIRRWLSVNFQWQLMVQAVSKRKNHNFGGET
jgi:hypothetical protein